MSELIIRPVCFSDMNDIASISRTTWEGDDYLERLAPSWMEDDGFYIGLLDERGIGTFRITLMPDRVLWFEGLRVHVDYRGKGYGRLLADAALEIAKEKIRTGEARCVEFSTYFLNSESIIISESQGFTRVNGFMLLTKENPEKSISVKTIDVSWKDFAICPGHIPCGWKFPVTCRESMEWVRNRAEIYNLGDVSFMMKNTSGEFTPLKGSSDNPERFLAGAETVASRLGKSDLQIFVHESYGS
ncbi:MAG: GNAT family N-acetyltransferase, partial [Candidatus Aegiribacteria sp.]|nr:GNAT family N-acetyltransferase [Candidatus Aegiribacteria sp.]